MHEFQDLYPPLNCFERTCVLTCLTSPTRRKVPRSIAPVTGQVNAISFNQRVPILQLLPRRTGASRRRFKRLTASLPSIIFLLVNGKHSNTIILQSKLEKISCQRDYLANSVGHEQTLPRFPSAVGCQRWPACP